MLRLGRADRRNVVVRASSTALHWLGNRGPPGAYWQSTIRYIDVMDDRQAAGLLKRARQRAKLSQKVLARRAGVTQSVVSAYESSRRQPSLPTLRRLVAAAGMELDVRVRGSRSGRAVKVSLADRVTQNRREILSILEKYGMSNVRIFGSVARGDESAESDIDLLVDLDAGAGLLAIARGQRELENLLEVRVEIVPAADLKPGVAAAALADAVPL